MSWGTTDLSVDYGDVTALDSISVDVESGMTLAVIGGDGAGKSTLLGTLAGLPEHMSGTVTTPPAQRLGYVPSQGGFYPDLSIWENLEFTANAYGFHRWQPRARYLLDRAGLGPFKQRHAGTLSGGQQRKLAGTLATLGMPELLILDEVTTGVDPVSRMELWRIVTESAAEGSAVIMSTTYLDEAERMNSCLLLSEGQCLAQGSVSDVVGAAHGYLYDLAQPQHRATAWRHGRRWKQWSQTPLQGHTTVPFTLQDSAIVLELNHEGALRGATHA